MSRLLPVLLVAPGLPYAGARTACATSAIIPNAALPVPWQNWQASASGMAQHRSDPRRVAGWRQERQLPVRHYWLWKSTGFHFSDYGLAK